MSKDESLTLLENEGAPLYQRVKDAIIDRILSGVWQEGARVPSENALTRELGISRMTVHRALRELTSEGWLDRTQGAGTFVAEAKPQSAVMEIHSIKDEIEARGHHHEAEVLLLRRESARALEAGLLELERGASLFRSLILHRENGQPVQLEDRYVSPELAPDYLAQDFAVTTPYDYLMAAAPLSEAEHTILAVLPDVAQAEQLEMDAGQPCLLLRRRTWSSGRPVSWAQLLYPGGRYRFGSRVTNPRGGFDRA